MKKYLVAFALAIGAMLSASAQQVTVSTGDGAGSTYVAMLGNIAKWCGNAVSLVPMPSSGSIENLDRLVGNKVNAAFVQSDMLYMRARTEDLGDIKTLLALHPEQLHFVVPPASGIKTGGMVGIGGKAVVFSDLADLHGYSIGASGGSVETLKIVRLQSEVNFTVLEYPDAKAVKEGLARGEVQAALFVGGAPLPSVESLPAGYRMLSISEALQSKMKGVYKPARGNYRNLGATGVPTVSTDALLVTRTYTTPKMVHGLGTLRACVIDNLAEIKETSGTHPAWRNVKADNKGPWSWYELPAPQPGTVKK